MWSDKKLSVLFLVGIFVLALSLRLIGIGSFMTVDEEKWMVRSGDFYDEMFRDHDPGGTFTTSHPGATTQWLSGLGIRWQEKKLGIGIDTSNLRYFRLVSTVPMAVVVSVLIVGVVLLLARLMGYTVGVWAGLLLATEPYFIGMSQIVHVDMLLALFMFMSALSFLLYVEERRWLWLVLGAVLAGFSFGTKLMPALWLVVFLGTLLLISSWFNILRLKQKDRGVWVRQIQEVVRICGFCVGIAMLTFYILWPALWEMTNVTDYYERDVVSVATQEHFAQAESVDPIQPVTFYVRTVLGRVTPFVLFMALALVILVVKYAVSSILFKHFVGSIARHDNKRDEKIFVSAKVVGWLIFYAVGYLALITLAAKKADRYALPALIVLPVLAGAGLVVAWPVVTENIKFLESKAKKYVLIVFILFSLLLQPFSWIPYTISYNSDLFNVRPLTQQGWGEGLDEAARWINNSPLVDRLTIASWYPGVMRTYFNGKTMSLSSRDDDRVGYVVTYRNMRNRAPDDIASNVLDEYRDKEPVYVVRIGGEEYVYVYETLGLHYFPKNTGELIGGQEVGQFVVAPESWKKIEIGMSNYSGRSNTQDIILQIKRGINDQENVRTVRINAKDVKDGEWQAFVFEAIEGEAGKEFYVVLSSPESVRGDAVTVRFVDRDVLDGQMVWRNRLMRADEKKELFIRPGYDLAYRLPER